METRVEHLPHFVILLVSHHFIFSNLEWWVSIQFTQNTRYAIYMTIVRSIHQRILESANANKSTFGLYIISKALGWGNTTMYTIFSRWKQYRQNNLPANQFNTSWREQKIINFRTISQINLVIFTQLVGPCMVQQSSENCTLELSR